MSKRNDNDQTALSYEYYTAIREQIMHEDNLINHRLGWLMVAHTLLFAGYVVLARLEISETAYDIDRLMNYVPIVGMVLCILTLFSVLGAALNMHRLRQDWNEFLKSTHQPQNGERYPPIGAPLGPLVLGLIAPVLMPITIFAAWTAVLVWL